ncbi:Transcription factor ILR3 [Hibiscus syriacus]|uniref:Transcription factor ILR3 n=1 Tax=Hibiscus syriacus TaxID=106335 RepID=A0A6A3AT02_HIBSY|nr:Transcription factor ILR3 [Hibiscus syriacus]
MELDSSDNSNWLVDYGITDFPPPAAAFTWHSQSTLNAPSNVSTAVDCSFADSDSLKEVVSRKRFLELGAILEPGRPLKSDKVAILSDAVRMVHQLRCEAQRLKQSNEELQAKIRELKVEKNELREEKQTLKADKEKLAQQVIAMSAAGPGLPPATISAQMQAAGNKLMPFIGFPSVAMWKLMPPAAVDTSQDHVLRPPVA